ncbi:TniB family NTP-binding protein [Mycobacterium sp. 29Ha]|uniref:TniB family NTP-binding protein n=1 Tax=Mycobacterium sp. 29Ha TaxID=2939268 RepID=UPI002938FA92|nr:TniB family NTP-binding protein [Mycobacterium sp. 29Ha]MDV3131367.1 TniB family NTP-binding protein [Mycobacterium sp. 29Ha]
METDEVRGIRAALAKTIRRNKNSPPGAKEFFALSGPNYVGKSTFIMRWARERYRKLIEGADTDSRGRPVMHPNEDVEVDLCPVVLTLIPAKAVVKSVNQEILACYGLPGDGDTVQLTSNAINAARRHGTQIIIFDDLHMLYTDWRGGRFVLDHIKNINTELGYTGTTFVLVGANIENSALVNDPQIAGRLTLRTLTPYPAGTVDERRTWQRVLMQLEELVLPHLPAGKRGMLYRDLAGELWLRTQGFVGDLKTLVGEALEAANQDGSHRILARHLEAATLTKRAEDEYREEIAERRRRPRSNTAAAEQSQPQSVDSSGIISGNQ